MRVKELPIVVWLALHLAMLPASVLALPYLALLSACQALITAPIFGAPPPPHPGGGAAGALWHALCAPLRVLAVAAATVGTAAIPGGGARRWHRSVVFSFKPATSGPCIAHS